MRGEVLDFTGEVGDELGARHGVVAQVDQRLAVHGRAFAHAVGGLLAIGAATGFGRAGNRYEGELGDLGHGR
ncbi:hypothetical protein G6F46_015111 [Rhizopus delemar]|nr:hypothetical protein G6F32_017140 [Rhizopus arrhizus]KAG0925099.1 hypothetical protein G6F31_018866 [Rhizopus arrhizus]KAG1242100.1 hypothetical protein G6F65_023184 [Rhizopus arrhizus]KAG1583394.1 hypothetical protein G6F46_015111 [Rhizopus delemar]